MIASAKAAVVRKAGGPFEIEAVSLQTPQPDEVLVRIIATGMCHTDIAMRDQIYPVPMPIVLGHEGAGIVERVGSGVRKVTAGDHVVLSFMSCGACDQCNSGHPAYCVIGHPLCFGGTREDGTTGTCDEHGRPIHDHFFGQSFFSSFALVNERTVVKVPKDIPLEKLGPLGCGIQTGAGAVINVFKVGVGSRFVTFGAGSVGLSAVMAARVAGAQTIIAVDVLPARLDVAMALGATHVIDASRQDAVVEIQKIARGGADYALETSGKPGVVEQAINALDIRGTCGIVGAAPVGTKAAFDMGGLMGPGKAIRGIIQGDSIPEVFIPKLIELHRQGRFPFDKLLRFYKLDEINQAAADSENGTAIKPVILMS